MDRRRDGTKASRGSKGFDGLVELADLIQRDAEVVMCLGVIGTELYGLSEFFQRRAVVSLVRKFDTPLVVLARLFSLVSGARAHGLLRPRVRKDPTCQKPEEGDQWAQPAGQGSRTSVPGEQSAPQESPAHSHVEGWQRPLEKASGTRLLPAPL